MKLNKTQFGIRISFIDYSMQHQKNRIQTRYLHNATEQRSTVSKPLEHRYVIRMVKEFSRQFVHKICCSEMPMVLEYHHQYGTQNGIWNVNKRAPLNNISSTRNIHARVSIPLHTSFTVSIHRPNIQLPRKCLVRFSIRAQNSRGHFHKSNWQRSTCNVDLNKGYVREHRCTQHEWYHHSFGIVSSSTQMKPIMQLAREYTFENTQTAKMFANINCKMYILLRWRAAAPLN